MSFLEFLQFVIDGGYLRSYLGLFDTIVINPLLMPFCSILVTSVCIYFVRRYLWG